MNIDTAALIRNLLPALITVALLIGVFWVADTNDVIGELRNFPVLGVFGVLALLGINLVIVSFRLTRLCRNFGIDLPMSIVTRANVAGHFAGLFFISLFAQVTGRHLVLRRSGIPSVVVAGLTAYERAVALVISGGLLLIGAAILLESLAIEDFLERFPLAEIMSVVAIGFILSIWLHGTSFEKSVVSKIFSWPQLKNAIEISVITVIARIFVMSAFVAAVTLLNADIDYLHLFAAAAITSFAANLPVTIHGWGLREVAAVSTLGLLGVPASEALAISILIGLCSTVVVVIAALIVIRKRDSIALQPELNVWSLQKGMEIEKTSGWILSVATAALVFFQVHVQVYGGNINLNLADPFAVLSIAALAANMATTKHLPAWRMNNFNSILIVISILLLFGFLHGLSEIGLTQWALANRLTGWFVLLGYLSAGYLIVSYSGNHGLRKLSETMIVFAVVIVLMHATLRYSALNGWIELSYLPFRFEGYAGNRNAFAFQMLACSVLVLAYSSVFVRADRKKTLPRETSAKNIVPLLRYFGIQEKNNLLLLSFFHGVILAGILFSGSRAGLITGAVLLLAVALLKLVDLRVVGLSIVFALIIWKLPTLILALGSDSNLTQLAPIRPSEVSDTERWETFTRAVALWLESPIIGGGLGVFIQESKNWSPYPINIHSTPLWILAEFGLVGAALFAWILFVVTRFLYIRGLNKPAYRLTAMLLLVFLLFGLVHEIFYQRIFWLILGAAMALPRHVSFPVKRTD